MYRTDGYGPIVTAHTSILTSKGRGSSGRDTHIHWYCMVPTDWTTLNVLVSFGKSRATP